MTDKSHSDEIEKMAFAPGWEHEHGVDYADYLDAVADGTYPANQVATDQVEPPDAGGGPGRNRTFLGFIPKDAADAVIAAYLQEAAALVASWSGDEEGMRRALAQVWEGYFAGSAGGEATPPDAGR